MAGVAPCDVESRHHRVPSGASAAMRDAAGVVLGIGFGGCAASAVSIGPSNQMVSVRWISLLAATPGPSICQGHFWCRHKPPTRTATEVPCCPPEGKMYEAPGSSARSGAPPRGKENNAASGKQDNSAARAGPTALGVTAVARRSNGTIRQRAAWLDQLPNQAAAACDFHGPAFGRVELVVGVDAQQVIDRGRQVFRAVAGRRPASRPGRPSCR